MEREEGGEEQGRKSRSWLEVETRGLSDCLLAPLFGS